jgi:hypothetical protein
LETLDYRIGKKWIIINCKNLACKVGREEFGCINTVVLESSEQWWPGWQCSKGYGGGDEAARTLWGGDRSH